MLRFSALIDSLCDIIGKAVAWLTLGMVLVTFAVVALRYLFDSGYIWMQESVVWMHGLVFLLAAAYTLRQDEHVRVDIFYRRMTARGRAWVDLSGTLLLLIPSMLFVLITSLGFVAQSWRVLETSSEAGGLQALYLLKSVIPVAAVLLLLQGAAIGLRALVVILTGEASNQRDAHTPGGKI
ncbi:MAG: TRAP transporter small permease subunit [Gammaproteobacteria bacterium]|nr:TRAP transporter small permease subunit [Gammaproteobacteria bacterium]